MTFIKIQTYWRRCTLSCCGCLAIPCYTYRTAYAFCILQIQNTLEVITQSPPKRKRKTNNQTVHYPPKEKRGCSPLVGLLVFGLAVSLYILLQSPSTTEEQHLQQTISTDKSKKQNTLEFDEVVIQNPDGTYRLHPKRSEKLHRDTLNLESSEQYVIKAIKSKYYPCLSCPYRDLIFLYSGEVWKYGTTINGKRKRYGNSLTSQDLYYEVQFRGTIAECLKQERIKIIRYPILPENLKRKNRIGRPPGNPNDN